MEADLSALPVSHWGNGMQFGVPLKKEPYGVNAGMTMVLHYMCGVPWQRRLAKDHILIQSMSRCE